MRSTKWHFTYLLTYLIFSLLLSSYRGWVCFSTLPVVRYKPWPKGTAFLSFASKTGFSAKSRLICLKFDHGRRPRRGAGGGGDRFPKNLEWGGHRYQCWPYRVFYRRHYPHYTIYRYIDRPHCPDPAVFLISHWNLMVFDPWIGDIVSIPCLQGRCKRDPGVPGVWRHKTPNPGQYKQYCFWTIIFFYF